MSINKLDQPGSTAPTENTDYTQQNVINVSGYMIGPAILTGWQTTGSEPDIENGTYIQYAGNIYQVQGGDENISGTIQEGLNYVILTTPDSGDTLEAAWGNDLTGYTYNEAYQGLYNTGALAIQAVCKKDSTVYNRGLYHNTTLTGFVYYGGEPAEIDGGLIVNDGITGDVTGDVTGDLIGDINYINSFTLTTTSVGQVVDLYTLYGSGLYVIARSSTSSEPTIGFGCETVIINGTVKNKFLSVIDTYRVWKFGG